MPFPNPNQISGACRVRSLWLLPALLSVFTLLAGCTASWRAPVESRGTPPVAQPQRSAIPRAARPPVLGNTYRVRRGDTLYGIAWQKGVDYRDVARWNGILAPYRIYAGQTLRLVAPPQPRPVKPPPRTSPAPSRAVSKPPAQTKPKAPSRAAAAPKSLAWRWPAQGKLLSRFKASDPLRHGIKIGGNSGSKITSAEAGKVVYSGSGLIGYGKLIIIKHNNKYLSAYGHNRKILVKEGDQVTKGQTIAEMGNANNGDPLLHFEIRRDGKPVDPLRLLPRQP